jgi:type VI secretion system secreted protein VgrG
MASYSQANRPLSVSTPLGPDVLLLAGFAGTEGVSAPFAFALDLLSEDDRLGGEALLRQPVVVTIMLSSGGERHIHGLVSQFMQFGRAEKLTAYRVEIVPALRFLGLTSECRIFQNLTALEIVQQVLRACGVAEVDVRCSRTYPTREYCVQYRETHLDFVSRLLEEEGIQYFFEHSRSRHLLVLSDDPTAARACPGGAAAKMAASPQPWQESDVVVELTSALAVGTGQVALRDYDPLQPALLLEGAVAGAQPGERYDYPGKFTAVAEGERYAKLRVEEHASRHQAITGSGNCRFFCPGFRFDLEEHYRRDLNAAYHLLEVRHSARAGDFRSWDSAPLEYRNEFTAVPAPAKYRPPRLTRSPIVHGSQTAVVVGPAGEEIWVDEHGRVKVQFHWDRTGRHDDASSCWIRVASSWAGRQWGAIQIPRIGQEVVVEFLEGDPDRPIIVGSVYNADQQPPYALPASKTQSGVKSRSSAGGGADNYNEIRFEDRKGDEQIVIHAERDALVEVEHDRRESVGNDETYSVGHDQTVSVGNDQGVTIGKNRTESVGADESITVTGSRAESVGKDESISIANNRTESVGKDESVDVGQHRTVAIARNERVTIGETRAVQVGKDDTLTVAKRVIVEAGDAITFRTGSASIAMKQNGEITIRGTDITIVGSGKVNVKASSDVVVRGSKVLTN